MAFIRLLAVSCFTLELGDRILSAFFRKVLETVWKADGCLGFRLLSVRKNFENQTSYLFIFARSVANFTLELSMLV